VTVSAQLNQMLQDDEQHRTDLQKEDLEISNSVRGSRRQERILAAEEKKIIDLSRLSKA